MHSNNSRPMSADDIQKAKVRASLLQDKYGKSSSPTSENIPQKTKGLKAPPVALPENRKPQLPQLRTNEVKKSLTPIPKYLLQKREVFRDLKRSSTFQEQLLEKLKKNQIQWRTPPGTSLLFLFIHALSYATCLRYRKKGGDCPQLQANSTLLLSAGIIAGL